MSKPRPPSQRLLDKYRGKDFHALYTTSVTVRGGEAADGRASGMAISDDGELVVELRLPVELGGTGGAPTLNSYSPPALRRASMARSACWPNVPVWPSRTLP